MMLNRPSFRSSLLLLALATGTAYAQTAAVPPAAPVAPTAPTAASALPLVPSAKGAAPATPSPILQPATTITAADLQQTASSSSMGDSQLSVFFLPNQIKALRDALGVFESKRTETGVKGDMSVEFASEEKQKIVEPDTYPVFYLSSIAYHSPTDWSIWVSGRKITSNKNPTTLQVLGVTADRASFAWKPAYQEAITARVEGHLFAPTDDVKNKLTNPSSYSYDEKTGVVNFSLLTNQSFVAGYFNTFEGFIPSPPLTSLTPDKPAAGAAPAKGAANALTTPMPAAPSPSSQVLHKTNENIGDASINAITDRFKRPTNPAPGAPAAPTPTPPTK